MGCRRSRDRSRCSVRRQVDSDSSVQIQRRRWQTQHLLLNVTSPLYSWICMSAPEDTLCGHCCGPCRCRLRAGTRIFGPPPLAISYDLVTDGISLHVPFCVPRNGKPDSVPLKSKRKEFRGIPRNSEGRINLAVLLWIN